jgi:hypothetical protein
MQLTIIPIKKVRVNLRELGIHIYLTESCNVRIETRHFRCEMSREEFLDLLRKALP